MTDEQTSVYEHCVRKLRFMRASGESAAVIERYAEGLQRHLGIDPAKAIADSEKPGSIDGYPYTAAARAGQL